MQKTVAIICFVIAGLGLFWEVFTWLDWQLPDYISTYDTEEGLVEEHREWVDVGYLKALDGSEIVVNADGLELRHGFYYVSSPLSLYVGMIIRWLAILTCFTAGLCLCKTVRQGNAAAKKT